MSDRLARGKPNYTRKLTEEVRAFLGSATPPLLAARLVAFFIARYPAPRHVKVACQYCLAEMPLLKTHRRDAPEGLRPGTADCDVNPIRIEFVFLCDKCAEEHDDKHPSF